MSERSPIHRRWKATPRLVRFILVGGVNTVFGYGSYALLLLSGLNYVAATFFGTIAGVLFNYFTTGGLVFKHLSRSALLRFVAVYGAIYVVNVACVALLGHGGINAYAAGLVLIVPMAALTYVLMSHFVFGGRRVAH